MKIIIYSIVAFFLFYGSLFGVEPDEILANSSLESRARNISSELRCLVCRNENIDSSNSDLARDLRILVRERLLLGDTDEEVLDFVHERYGDFILLRPKFSGIGVILWLLVPFSFILGSSLVFVFIWRNRSNESPDTLQEELSSSELKKIKDFLEK